MYRSNFGILTRFTEQGRVLVLTMSVKDYYHRRKSLHESIIFPGGSMLQGETDKENLLRELAEEISLKQQKLNMDPESLRAVLSLHKPSDFGGGMIQSFWYMPFTDSIHLRTEDEPFLLESDGAKLGPPQLMDIEDFLLRKDVKLAHFAAAIVFLGKLEGNHKDNYYKGVNADLKELIREQYGTRFEAFLQKTRVFLLKLRYCCTRESYNRLLYNYSRALGKSR